MIVSTRSIAKFAALYACIGSLSAGIVWAQATNSADVTGAVTDASGAIVPGVSVLVRDLDKNVERTFVTNDHGLYDTGPLVPDDRYVISFKKEGFATIQRGPMTLSAGLLGMNVQLSVAQAAEQVVVQETAAPLLQTTTAEIASTIPFETLKNLPQTGGIPDWQSFITYLPGTRGNGSNNSGANMGATSVNGAMPFTQSLMDGVSTNSPMSNNVINTPIFDSIGEVKMTDSAFSSQ